MSASLRLRFGGAAAEALDRHVPGLVQAKVASALAAGDPTLWGERARAEASIRLGWVHLPHSSRPLLATVETLRAELVGQGLDHVVLAGMGGSSLAPEVIAATAGVRLTVLDSTDPDQVRAALAQRLERTVVVVSSKSGTTLETDSQRRAFEAAFVAAGIDPVGRIVVVTDPGSPLEASARDAGHRVFTADPNVGGRYSALTAFGLVPSGLAGVDIGALLDEAEAAMAGLAADDPANPALRLGAALAGTDPLRDKVVLVPDGTAAIGLGEWIEQLVAESTGKDGTGLLPVVLASPEDPEAAGGSDLLVVRLTGEGRSAALTGPAEVSMSGPLGALMLLWEHATAVAGRLLGINPFDQPDVESAKAAARDLLAARPQPEPASFVEDGVAVRATAGLLDGVVDLAGAVAALLGQLSPDGYLAVMAYLDRVGEAGLAEVRAGLARRTNRPVTFGWGPRFLHSTGQYHKGGPANGVYLQITGVARQDLAVPGRPFSFGELIAAQASGDAQVLAGRGRPVLRLHVLDRTRGLAALRRVLR